MTRDAATGDAGHRGPRRISDYAYVHTRPLLGYGGDVSSVLFLGAAIAVVVDTMYSPGDMEPFARMAGDRRVLVAYTHADWDHCLGSAAFPSALVISQDLARARLTARGHAGIDAVGETDPGLVAGGSIVPPGLTFSDRLTLSLSLEVAGAGEDPGEERRLILVHLPGHTADSAVCLDGTSGILVAGDAVEDPFPSIGTPATAASWAAALERLEPEVTIVVPGHGRVQGPELLRANAAYLKSVLGLVKDAAASGVPGETLARDIPLEKAFPEALPKLAAMRPRDRDFYIDAHKRNLMRIRSEWT